MSSSSISLCSSLNTAETNAIFSIYQSVGRCMGNCSDYAFGILYGKNCYCSNYAPGDTTSLSDCNTPCPGWTLDDCGDTSAGLYAYVQLADPSGTEYASSSAASSTRSSSSTSSSSSSTSTSTTSTTSSTTKSSSTSTSTSTTSTSSSTTSTTPASSSSPSSSTAVSSSTFPSSTESSTSSSSIPSSTSSTTSSSSSSSTTETPEISVITVTGAAETQTITRTNADPTLTVSTASDTPSASAVAQHESSYWDNKGKVAGTFVPVALVAAALLALLIFFCCRRRRKDDDNEKAASPPLPLAKRMSVLGFKGAPTSPVALKRDPSTSKTLSDMNDRIVVDQRLDPSRMYMQFEENDSRFSLQDEHDYSRRVLRVANPDQ